MRLLSVNGNAKLRKRTGETETAVIAGLTLAPADRSGFEVCPHATDGCRAACVLWYAGRTVTPVVRNAMARRTRRFFRDREGFLSDLFADLDRLARRANRDRVPVYVRLNVASDIDWVGVTRGRVLDYFPSLRFYDYSKDSRRVLRYRERSPLAYPLTFSLSEARTSDADALRVLRSGANVVGVASDIEYVPSHGRIGPIPDTFTIAGETFATFDADAHDIRRPETDGSGRVGVLRLKGTRASKRDAIASGFARPTTTALTIGATA